MTFQIRGLVAATHTPFDKHGELSLHAIDAQAELLSRSGVKSVFVGGSTGESHSLTVVERLALAKRWSEVVRGTDLQLIVHVGSNCLHDARELATHAQSIHAKAISALSPSYFKPRSLETLIDCCASIVMHATETPFYFYDIPVLTGVQFSMSDFLGRAKEKVPSLSGIKFTNPDLMAYQKCLHANDASFDIPWGVDEYLLAALSLGARGAVGSSYNFAGPLYNRLIAAFERGDLEAARKEQYRSVQLIDLLAGYGYMAAAKAVMGFLGVDVGPPRLPNAAISDEQKAKLRASLESLGFFDWL
jgi:N-acetylneuraminate lyase